MRTWYVLVTAAMLGMAVTLTACSQKPLLSEASFSEDLITPNADHDSDVLVITYDLSRSAEVSIYLEDELSFNPQSCFNLAVIAPVTGTIFLDVASRSPSSLTILLNNPFTSLLI